ncbi:MAG: acyl-CoA carboxylase subunit beta [Acidimicrobiia bacterium]
MIGSPPAVPLAACRGGAATASLTELDGRRVGWFRLAGGKHAGALGPTEGDVLARLVRSALDLGIPVVGEVSTSGADVGEGLPALHAWGRVAAAVAEASGAVPVLLAVTGPCVGGPALLLGLADHVVMTTDAFAYLNGPPTVAEITGQVIEPADLGGAGVHHRRSGLASLVVPDEEDARWALADLLSYLPSNYLESPPVLRNGDEADRPSRAAADAVPANRSSSYDVREVVADVLDEESFLEVRSSHAANVVVGYGRVDGHAVGVVANQPRQLAGTLDIEASQKAARFVQSCDAFGLPLVTFVDCPGYQPGKDQEWRGMIRHGAELVHAYAEATVPRVCVVMRKAYGGAYIVLDSKGLGNDVCVAWPTAEIAVMGAAGAVSILHGKRLAGIEDPAERARVQAELEADYSERLCTPAVAAERGYVDDVIDPLDTRRVVAAALASLRTKRAVGRRPRVAARHSNTPV